MSTHVTGGLKYRTLTLRYVVESAGRRAELVKINLEDTMHSEPADRLRCWFYYQPVVVPWPKGDDDTATNLIRLYPSIDLIVFSTIRVIVQRHVDTIDEFQQIGFEGLELGSRARDAMFSPVRPKIALRRVHREAQIPLQGSPFHFPSVQPAFSFYADSQGEPNFTLLPNLAALIDARGIAAADHARAGRSWTHVDHDDLGTHFMFPQSTYDLRAFDQHYDEIDGKSIPADIGFEDALSMQHEAAQLISQPKRFSYEIGWDRHAQLKEGRMVHGQVSLQITKSQNVHLAGTISRDTHSDSRTRALLAKLPSADGLARPVNYKDDLPSVGLYDEEGRLIRGGPLEESWPPPANYEFTKSGGQQFFEFQVSLIIGFTPIAGEAFGLYELYTAVQYDRDAFGNKLTDTEKVLIGIAAALPFVSFGALKRGVNFVSRDVYPMLAAVVDDSASVLAQLRTPAL
ncbi:MAG: hypothetical protein U1F54_14035 [Burkholderiales bacterium]